MHLHATPKLSKSSVDDARVPPPRIAQILVSSGLQAPIATHSRVRTQTTQFAATK